MRPMAQQWDSRVSRDCRRSWIAREFTKAMVSLHDFEPTQRCGDMEVGFFGFIDACDGCGTACPGNVGKMGEIGIACSTSNARLNRIDPAHPFFDGWRAVREGKNDTATGFDYAARLTEFTLWATWPSMRAKAGTWSGTDPT